MMKTLSLKDFISEVGQAEAARLLGVKPPSLSKAKNVGRNITVNVGDDGTCSAFEVRPFPSQSTDKSQSAA